MAESIRIEGYLDLDLDIITAAATGDKQSVSLNEVITRVCTRNLLRFASRFFEGDLDGSRIAIYF